MVDVKTCLDNAQEKMDMAVMYLEEALATYPRRKSSTRLLDGIRVELLRKYGSYQQCLSSNYSRCTYYHHQTVG